LGAAEEQRIRVMQRALGAVLVTWLPLLLLSVAYGLAFSKHIPIPFVLDFAVNVRFLIALPLLILSEVGIDRRLRVTVNHFLKSGLVKEADLPSFEAVIEKVTRLRDRVLPEIVILVVAYLPSLSIHSPEILMGRISSWHLVQTSSGQTLSYAGWWFGLISAPVYRFLLLRWVWRMFLWASFLWRVSKLNLVLIPTHPDMAAGIGFLSEAQLRFGLIAFACGAVVAGQMGNAIVYQGATVGELNSPSSLTVWWPPSSSPHRSFSWGPDCLQSKNEDCSSTERWRPSTHRRSIPSGFTESRRKARCFWEVRTFSLSPIWVTVSPSCGG
jgi:hypothetical protein